MKTRLVGVHRTEAKGRVYYYAWRGGPRMYEKPGTNAFTQEFARLTREKPKKDLSETIGWLATQYLASADFQKLAASTKRDYERIIGIIRVKFGTFHLLALEAKGARKVFLDWRDTMREAPRAADLSIAVLARMISWAKDKELVMRNPLEKVSKLHESGSRKDAIWMPSQLNTFFDNAAPHLVDVVKLALWTMQRQGDVLTMPTIAYDDGRLWIIQGKTKTRVRIRPPEEVMPIINRAKEKKQQRILVNSFGENWTSDGFRTSFGRETKRLEIKGVTFHDLRGTGISYAYANGMDIEKIADISGHSKTECEGIIRRHYLAGSDVMDAIRSGTKL